MLLSQILRTCALPGRWAAPLLVAVMAAGGIGVTPAVAGSARLCDYNPALFAKGSTVKYVAKYTLLGSPPYTAEVDSKVMGLATFHGLKAIDIRKHMEGTYPGQKMPSGIVDEFDQIGGKFIYEYGSRNQSGAESYSDPPMSIPKQYVIDVPYTSISVIHTSGNGTESSSNRHVTTTFLGMESITVPAGTFMTCKMKKELFSGSGEKPSITYTWIVSSGRYAGLPAKDEFYSPTGSSTGKVVALSILVSGK